MVLNAYTAAQITATEKPHLAAGAPLMARAAHALAAEAARMLAHRTSGAYGADVVVLAGSGNNGGDALHAGALLRLTPPRTPLPLPAVFPDRLPKPLPRQYSLATFLGHRPRPSHQPLAS